MIIPKITYCTRAPAKATAILTVLTAEVAATITYMSSSREAT